MKVSVIIPTFNEEKCLPQLLEDIENQDFKDYEVIVADALSKDKTRKIAREFGAKVVEGGSPSEGRNKGARVARGELLYFLDADVRIHKDFLKNTYEEIKEKSIYLATCEIKPIVKNKKYELLYNFFNIIMKLRQFSSEPRGIGACILVYKDIFDKIGGFREELKLAEDHDFIVRGCTHTNFRVLTSSKISLSVRRLDKEGILSLIVKYFKVELHLLLRGEITEDIIEYEFGNYEVKKRRFEYIKNKINKLDEEIDNFMKSRRELTKRNIKKFNDKMKDLALKIFYED